MLRSTRFALRTVRQSSVRSLATPAYQIPTTVEDLHHKSAEEVLAEREGGKSGVMRHFTVNFGCVGASLSSFWTRIDSDSADSIQFADRNIPPLTEYSD